jgi:predicted GNAT family acetyltransferase
MATENHAVHVVVEAELARYAARVLPFLGADPIRNNILTTLIEARLNGGMPVEQGARWLAAIDADGRVCGAALRTPPRGLGFSPMPAAAIEAIAVWAAANEPLLPNCVGPQAEADAFAERYSALTGRTARISRYQRMFDLETVIAPRGVPGHQREAKHPDRDLVVAWAEAFHADATPEVLRTDVVPGVDARLAEGGRIWFWVDQDRPVSMLWVVPANGVVRVSGVYTPPDLRGHGYAGANVAAASQHALDGGALACMLYTDLANPTSNKIYQQIGYRPVCDVRDWWFGPSGETDGA